MWVLLFNLAILSECIKAEYVFLNFAVISKYIQCEFIIHYGYDIHLLFLKIFWNYWKITKIITNVISSARFVFAESERKASEARVNGCSHLERAKFVWKLMFTYEKEQVESCESPL